MENLTIKGWQIVKKSYFLEKNGLFYLQLKKMYYLCSVFEAQKILFYY